MKLLNAAALETTVSPEGAYRSLLSSVQFSSVLFGFGFGDHNLRTEIPISIPMPIPGIPSFRLLCMATKTGWAIKRLL